MLVSGTCAKPSVKMEFAHFPNRDVQFLRLVLNRKDCFYKKIVKILPKISNTL